MEVRGSLLAGQKSVRPVVYEGKEAARNAKVVDLVFKSKATGEAEHALGGAVTAVQRASATRVIGTKCGAQETSVDYNKEVIVPSYSKRAPLVTWGRKPRQHRMDYIPDLYRPPTTRPRRARRASALHPVKKLTFHPLVFQGKFSVPSVVVCGDDALDGKLGAMMDLYSAISVILEVKHTSAILAKMKRRKDTLDDVLVKILVSWIRDQCFRLRAEVASLGGALPLEPLAYWRDTFYYAKF